jgi:TonB family protein
MKTQSAGDVIFLEEIGRLDPNFSRPVSLFVPLNSPLGNGKYELYLFSGGVEVFQTMIPFWVRDAALNRMVAKRVADVTSAAPRFFIGPVPEYPPALKRENVNGRAVISIRIKANGVVADPVVKSATDPAFGLSALAAIQDWRFIPKVKDGYPVETRADVPFVFSPPHPEKNGP